MLEHQLLILPLSAPAPAGEQLHAATRVHLPAAGYLKLIALKARGVTAGAASPVVQVRAYAASPEDGAALWFLEVAAPSLNAADRMPDVLAQGLDVPIPQTCWLTTELADVELAEGARLDVMLAIECQLEEGQNRS